ncbi:hypothetical protein BGZ51_003711 [Haplosporangium sp. Z 767]|nr:hypothetical protein BGZ51_003711 [Haplosporangium sp. Z 767]KAF9184458.1 hypothetical protein BGZ50_003663 [Haplosporangium sp. Z 11]
MCGPQYDRLYERLALFEQESGIRVEIVFKGSHPELNDYLSRTFEPYYGSSSIESVPVCSPPDLDLISTHIKYAPSQSHFLQELDTTMVLDSEREEFLESALEACKVQGDLMQLPRMVDSRVLFYRADIFQQLGLQPPQTWRDLLYTASKIHNAAVPILPSTITAATTRNGASAPLSANKSTMQGYVFPGKLSGLFGTFYELAMMEMQHPEALFDHQDRPVFEEPVLVAVLEYMRELVVSGAVPQELEEYYFDQVSDMFAEGRVAIVADWPSYYGEMKQKLKEKILSSASPVVKVMRYPIGQNGKRSAYSGMHTFAIPKSCRYPQEALKLLKFLVRDDQQWIEASESGSFPTKKAVLNRLSEETEKRCEGGADALAVLDSERLGCLRRTVEEDMAMFPHLRSYPELEDALYPMIQDAMMGRRTPKEAAQLMRATALQSV